MNLKLLSQKFLLLLGIGVLACCVDLQAQVHWSHYPQNPVLDFGPAGSWDARTAFLPFVIKSNDTLKMWYSGTAISQIFTIPEIGYAWSLDGVNWNRSANPVLPKRPGKWDDGGTAQATVLQDGDTLRMWYTGAGADPTEFQDIGFAISTDGIHWTKYQGNPILESPDTWTDDIFSPSVILDGDQYRMWFSGSEPVFPFDAKIGYATAPVAIPAPVIVSIHDVPNDQGRQVRVTWNSSRFDGIDPTHKIIEYNVWRKVDGGAAQSASLSQADLGRRMRQAKASGGQLAANGGLWDFVGSVPSHQFPQYAVVVPTLADSTAAGIALSTFFVSAHTSDPAVFFDSQPAAGYSVDNLAPSAPQGVVAKSVANAVELEWQAIPDADFRYYAIYRSTQSGFVPAPENLRASTIDTIFVDSQIDPQTKYYYRIAAFDFSGNQSRFSAEVSALVTSVEEAKGSAIPTVFALHQNYPNPFNPSTMINFDVPRDAQLTVKIYDALGREVRTLLEGHLATGAHHTVWDGKDNHGVSMGSGVYFVKLTTEGFESTKRLMLVK
jgi:predicted GH43/DUF377 family glycosyl hydrolase